MIYGLGTAAGSLANLVLLPLYGHRLSPAEFGRLETLTAAQQVLLILCAAGMGSSLFSLYCDEADPTRRRALAGTALCLVAAAALALAGVAMVAAPWLGAVVLRGAEPEWIRLAAVQASGGAIVLVPLAVLRARGAAIGFVCLSVGQVLATAGLAAVAVAGLHLGVMGVLAAGALVSGVLGLATLVGYGIAGGLKFDRSLIRSLLGLGACHVPSSIAAWVTQLADRYFLLWAAGPAQVGLYGMGYKLGSLPAAAVSQPLALAWPSHLSGLARHEGAHAASAAADGDPEGGAAGEPTGGAAGKSSGGAAGELDSSEREAPNVVERACSTALEYAVAAAAGIGVAAFLFVDLLLSLVAEDAYSGAAPIVSWILAGNVFTAAYPVLLSGINLSGRYGLYPVLTGAGAVTNLGLNALLIPRFGATGAAAATTAAYACQAALAFAVSRALRPIAFPWGRLAALLLIAASAAAAGQSGGYATKAACLAAFAGLTLVWLRLRPSERPAGSAGGWWSAPGGPSAR